ncbi:MAG: alanine--tRNA ligase [Ilumatobacteraceae bacterium]
MNEPPTTDEIRSTFLEFFAARDHTVVPSASLIPHDPSLLFNVAGMVPFKPYFLGDETPPYRRATASQKCVRAGGKHNDLDEVGRNARHLVFFEMLGNFSFGDYFKELAIPYSWELVTEGFGFDGDRIWITVHESDDEAEQIWHDVVGVPMERIQRLGDEDNFWQMGDTGPCGPDSELHFDRGPSYGPDGGPQGDPAGDRFMEFWNLVFMQFVQDRDGTRTPLPRPSIDTGAGLERLVCLLQGVEAVWETDLMAPLVARATALTGRTYRAGEYDDRDSFAIRALAEHACSCAMLIGDGVFPSNEGRGYVLRRILRRAVRFAYLTGTQDAVMPALTETAIDVMGNAYPGVAKQRDYIVGVVANEEERFRHTLRNGLSILDHELDDATDTGLSGETAFVLHDTYGFPLELTQEIAAERGTNVDIAGFQTAMTQQRERAKAARRDHDDDDARLDAYRELVEQFGVTEFVGYRARRERVAPAGCTARRGRHGRVVPRSHAVLRREWRPGRRHRQHHDRHRSCRGARHGVCAAEPASPRRQDRRRHDRGGPAGNGAYRRRTARCHPAQPHGHAPRPLRAAGGARRPRQAGRLARRSRPPALRLLALRGRERRRDPRDRTHCQRRDARQHADADLRDDDGGGRAHRCDRVLR